MFLDIQNHDYDKDIIPFIKNGIIIDTSVIKIFVDGLVSIRISKKKLDESPEYKNLLYFFDIIKVSNQWSRFIITPHILTEVCTHLRNDYRKNHNYKEIIEEVLPLLKDMGEKPVEKHRIISGVNFANPVIEVGDISIFVVAQDFIDTKKKIAILAKDKGINKEFQDNPNVMVMDYQNIMLNNI